MINFFKDGDKLSMGRLLSLITCITGLTMGVICAVKGEASASLASMALGFVTAGITGKVLSKGKE